MICLAHVDVVICVLWTVNVSVLDFFCVFVNNFPHPCPPQPMIQILLVNCARCISRYLFAALTNPEYRTQGRLDKEDWQSGIYYWYNDIVNTVTVVIRYTSSRVCIWFSVYASCLYGRTNAHCDNYFQFAFVSVSVSEGSKCHYGE